MSEMLDVAVFFDYENITYSLREKFRQNPNFEALMDRCQEYGRVVMARAYADWSRHTTVISSLQASGFDPVYVPTYFYNLNEQQSARKNAVDIHMAIETIELIHSRPHISVFVILTGDKDFIPLANALRRHGKMVVALGVKGTTSPYLQQAVDDFIFYHQVLADSSTKTQAINIFEALIEAIKILQKDKQSPLLPRVKHTMGELLDGFDEKQFKDSNGRPYQKFKDFILDAQQQGYVYLKTEGRLNEVRLAKKAPPKKEKHTEEKKREEKIIEKKGNHTNKQNSQTPIVTLSPQLKAAFSLLVQAVKQAKEEDKSFAAGGIKSLMRQIKPDFDEKQIVGMDGKPFSNFTRFARAAASYKLIRIEGKGMKTFILPVKTLPEGIISEKTPPASVTSKVGKKLKPISEQEARQLMIAALSNFDGYPALPVDIDRHCKAERDRQQVDLPDTEVHRLLGIAVRQELLQTSHKRPDSQQKHMVFVDSQPLIDAYLQMRPINLEVGVS